MDIGLIDVTTHSKQQGCTLLQGILNNKNDGNFFVLYL